MENIENAVQLLMAVRSTMNDISIKGIDNQDKFIGCANAIQTVIQFLQDHSKEAEDGR